MHELSVVQALVEQVTAEAARLGATGRIRAVYLRLGALTTYVPAALTFYYDALTRDTPLAGSRLEVEEVAVAGSCRACGAPATFTALPFLCPACGAADVDLTAGRELEIYALDVDDDRTGD
jgi:hydrogenase nickel incorporation protein HypA/HybF